jgi:hypothetical protein
MFPYHATSFGLTGMPMEYYNYGICAVFIIVTSDGAILDLVSFTGFTQTGSSGCHSREQNRCDKSIELDHLWNGKERDPRVTAPYNHVAMCFSRVSNMNVH